MKWIQGSIVSLTLFACISRVKASTKEELGTLYFRLYTGNDIEKYVDVHIEEAKSLPLSMDHSKPTVIYIHGFTESVNSTSVQTVVKGYLMRQDHNILVLDWSVIAADIFPRVVGNMESVGIVTGIALDDMVQVGLPSQKIHIIGHSLGSHVAGYISVNVNFPIQRITGLDPAGPFFHFLERHLKPSDAKFVDIIHTDWGFYGIARTVGTVDFFPNGGRRIQPGCPTSFALYSDADFCSHRRSWGYYAESLKNEQAFLAVECIRQFDHFRMIIMGYATPTDAKGSYCLVTNATEPYGLGIGGAHEA